MKPNLNPKEAAKMYAGGIPGVGVGIALSQVVLDYLAKNGYALNETQQLVTTGVVIAIAVMAAVQWTPNKEADKEEIDRS